MTITQKKNIRIFLNYFLGPLLFIWLSFSIYNQLRHQPDLSVKWLHIKNALTTPLIWNLITAIILMFVNWGLEAWKWKLSIQQLQKINFTTSFKAVLAGVCFSVTMPNRIGEYLGRILFMNEENRLRSVSLTIVSSISQLIITLLFGFIGVLSLQPHIKTSDVFAGINISSWLFVLQYGTLAAIVVLLLLYFRLKWLQNFLQKFFKHRRFDQFTEALKNMNGSLLINMLLISAIRYLVFSLQYFLLFHLFEVNVSCQQSFLGVGLVFLVMAIVPSFAIAELGLRGKVSLKILSLFSANALGIAITAGTIWIINLVLPAIIGSLLILRIKIFKKNEEV